VRHVVFHGLTFEHADWKVGPQGYFDLQGAIPASSAVEAVGAVNFLVERCTFAHSGGSRPRGRGPLRRPSEHPQLYVRYPRQGAASLLALGICVCACLRLSRPTHVFFVAWHGINSRLGCYPYVPLSNSLTLREATKRFHLNE
jgi:hypothetical protein